MYIQKGIANIDQSFIDSQNKAVKINSNSMKSKIYTNRSLANMVVGYSNTDETSKSLEEYILV